MPDQYDASAESEAQYADNGDELPELPMWQAGFVTEEDDAPSKLAIMTMLPDVALVEEVDAGVWLIGGPFVDAITAHGATDVEITRCLGPDYLAITMTITTP